MNTNKPRACPHCGAVLDPLGAALAGRVAWVSAAPCPCEGAASEREAEARRRAALAAKEEAALREKALSRAGIPRRYWAAEADRPEFAEYIASFAGNGGAGLYICVCSIESGPCERVDVFHVSGRFWSTSACGEKRTPARPAWTSFPS